METAQAIGSLSALGFMCLAAFRPDHEEKQTALLWAILLFFLTKELAT